jgi:protein CrcB
MTDAARISLTARALGGGALMYACVAAGAAIGGVGRALVSLAAIEVAGSGFPWGTLVANVLGSFVIGFYATLTEPGGRLMAGARARQFVMTGMCGGFTTFSVFSLETLRFLAEKDWTMAGVNVGASVTTWLLAVWAGAALAGRINRLSGDRNPLQETKGDGLEMDIPKDAQALRIFIGEDDRDGGRPLYEAIVLKAREMHIAGATVLRGALGYGHSSRLHTTKVLRLSEDLPLVVEIVDSEEKIAAFLPELDKLMTSGLVTLETVRVLQYGAARNTG